jgi:hypothetical protein
MNRLDLAVRHPSPDHGAYYYAWLRVWNATSARPHIVPVFGFAGLTTSSSATLNVTIR